MRAEECTKEKLNELNGMTDNKVLIALKVLEEPPILRKIGDKQRLLNRMGSKENLME